MTVTFREVSPFPKTPEELGLIFDAFLLSWFRHFRRPGVAADFLIDNDIGIFC